MSASKLASANWRLTVPDDPLSDDDFKRLLELLRRFCEADLDQYDHWRLQTDHGAVYVDISRRPSHTRYRDMTG